jgi:hypothetical protein
LALIGGNENSNHSHECQNEAWDAQENTGQDGSYDSTGSSHLSIPPKAENLLSSIQAKIISIHLVYFCLGFLYNIEIY